MKYKCRVIITILFVLLELRAFANLPDSIGASGTLIDSSWVLTSYTDQNKVPSKIVIGGVEYPTDRCVDEPYGLGLRLLHLARPALNARPIPRVRSVVQDLFYGWVPGLPMFGGVVGKTTFYIPKRTSKFDEGQVLSFDVKDKEYSTNELEPVPFYISGPGYVMILVEDAKNSETWNRPNVLVGGSYLIDNQNPKLVGIKTGVAKRISQIDGTQKIYKQTSILLDPPLNTWIDNVIIQTAIRRK